MSLEVVLITATTSAVDEAGKRTFYVPNGATATLHASALTGAEEVDCYFINADNSETLAYNADGAIVLTATLPQVQFDGPVNIRVAKDVTASACSVGVLF